MAKQYKLMKVEEGIYNIRRSSNNEAIGGMVIDDNGEWEVRVLGYQDKFKTKEKAQGFIRGVFVAKNLPSVAVYGAGGGGGASNIENDDIDRDSRDPVIEAVDRLIDALHNFSTNL